MVLKYNIMISVVMATYNGSKYIIEQLDSIKNQTKVPDEVIICDDCSTDDTCKIIEDYLKLNHLKGWKLFRNKKNKGFYMNFFNALERTKGDIIFLSDQDDIWDEKKIETFSEYYEQHSNISMIQSFMCFIDSSGKLISDKNTYHDKKINSGFVQLTSDDMCRFTGSGYTMSFRRDVKNIVFQNNLQDYYATYLYHDILLGLVASATGECYLCTDIVDKHRLHDTNATQSKGHKHISNRTKEMQITILKRRINEFQLIEPLCTDDEKSICFKKFKTFASIRKELICSQNFSLLKEIYKERECYSTKFGIITDVLYALNCEKLLLFIFSKI